MFIPEKIVDWITSVKLDEAPKLREENAALRAERDAVKSHLSALQFQFDWVRLQINALQLERSALIEKVYGIKVPAPELVRTPTPSVADIVDKFSFDDMGDEVAKKLGYPVYQDR